MFPELDDDEEESLRCLDCNLTFGSKRFLYSHLTGHIQQPFVKLDRVLSTNPPLKITLKVSKVKVIKIFIVFEFFF